MATAAAARYARALVDVATEPGSALQPEDARAQLHNVAGMLADSAELRTAMITPAIQPARKKAAMGALLDRLGAAPLIRNFVFVLLDHQRIALMPEIADAFDSALDERLGFARADVASAEPLSPDQSGALQSELSRLSGKSVKLRITVDPSLLGGVVARIGSTVYDGSVRGQLQQMRRRLMGHTADYQVGS